MQLKNIFSQVADYPCWLIVGPGSKTPTCPVTLRSKGWPSAGSTFDQASERMPLLGPRGWSFGINLGKCDRLVILDLDSCIDQDGTIADWAIELVELFGSLTEFSRSFSGLHIFGLLRDYEPAPRSSAVILGDVRGHGGHLPQADVFYRRRWIALSGNLLGQCGNPHYKGRPCIELANVDDAMRAFDEKYPAPKREQRNSPRRLGTVGSKDFVETHEFVDYYNSTTPIGKLLTDAGWTDMGNHRYLRPGKRGSKCSADIVIDDRGIERLRVYSQSTPLSPTPTTHSAWDVNVALNHAGRSRADAWSIEYNLLANVGEQPDLTQLLHSFE